MGRRCSIATAAPSNASSASQTSPVAYSSGLTLVNMRFARRVCKTCARRRSERYGPAQWPPYALLRATSFHLFVVALGSNSCSVRLLPVAACDGHSAAAARSRRLRLCSMLAAYFVHRRVFYNVGVVVRPYRSLTWLCKAAHWLTHVIHHLTFVSYKCRQRKASSVPTAGLSSTGMKRWTAGACSSAPVGRPDYLPANLRRCASSCFHTTGSSSTVT